MYKLIIASIVALTMFLSSTGFAFAAPFNASNQNPNITAYYNGQNDVHAIADNPVYWVTGGKDLVMLRGNSGNLQQWYQGEDGTGVHSVWNISKDGTCPNGWLRIANAYPTWGDYLIPGATYCVNNNSFGN